VGIAIQVAMIALLVGVMQVDWGKHFGGEKGKDGKHV
jgi:hypothetical protein